MKVLITGANGLLGQRLVQLYEDVAETEVIATARSKNRIPVGSYRYMSMDITVQDDINMVFDQTKPDVVINTAAMTQVDQCETEKELCWQLNVTAVSYLKKACEKHRSFLIHLSTDFVFDGLQGPYKETDEPHPLNYYAESKLASEKLIAESTVRHAIVRTTLVYGITHDMSPSNIILWIKNNLEENKPIKMVSNQWRAPTFVGDLAKSCALIAEKQAEGVFHISGKDMLNPYQMAMKTAALFKLDQSLIEQVDSSIFTQPAKRPPKTDLILDKARSELGYEPVSFEDGLMILKSQLDHV